jgi:cell division protein FtsI (penicillin-binding protein 3)
MTRLFRAANRSRLAVRQLVRKVRVRPATLDPLADDDRPGQAFEKTWRPAMKRRVLVIVAAVGLWAIGIEARLVQLQVFQYDSHVAAARRKQERELTPAAPRGDINDRRGRMLAYAVPAHNIYADPTVIDDPAKAAAALCDVLDCPAAERRDLVSRLKGRGKYVPIRRARDISPTQADAVKALNLRGIVLEADSLRYYPGGELAASVLGFVGDDNHGLAGVEFVFDDLVRGTPGLAVAQVNAKLQRLETRVVRPPVPGATLELTIDRDLQYIAERELKRGVIENGARAGTAVIMNPMTGELLAIANYPTYDPNIWDRVPKERRKNRAVQDIYEPGSTFKIVTAAAALEHGIVTPTDLIDCNPGVITFPGRRITEAKGHNYGVLSFEDVIVRSSNIGAIRVGLSTGAARLSEYVERFGFGHSATRELPGGTDGLWNPAGLNQSGLASVSMGYQIGVTPLQMAAAASAVANGGQLMRPRIVQAIIHDGKREARSSEVVRRVIRPETAATLTAIMEGVTERGTATSARLDRYQVAGKTGTANKAIGGGYSDTDFHASFVGFVPSRRPVFTILVVIDTPRGGSHYGGTVAGPIFRRIAEAGLQHLGVPPTIDPVPPVMLASDREPPPAPRQVPTIIPAAVPLGGSAPMPDVRGLSARQALRLLAGVGLQTSVTGSGFVVEQTPAPGVPLAAGGRGTIQLARRPARSPVAGVRR